MGRGTDREEGGLDDEVEADADGRRRRRQRSREAVVAATVALLEEGHAQPSTAAIADRAGISTRSVFRLFEDLDGLFTVAIQQRARETAHLYAPPPPGRSTPERVASMVEQRSRLHEAITATRRFAVAKESLVAPVHATLDRLRRSLRDQVATHFAEELAAAGEDAPAALDALDVLLSWEAWDHLRTAGGCSAEAAGRAVAHTTTALVRPPDR